MKNFFLIVLLFAFLWPVPSSANWWDSICRMVAGRAQDWLGAEDKTALLIAHQKYLAIRKKENGEGIPPPEKIEVKGVSYKVIQSLGWGSEGDVYKAEGPDGAVVSIKVFFTEQLLEENIHALRRKARMGFLTPGILAMQGKTLVMDYVSGIPVQEILKNNALGISLELRAKIQSELRFRYLGLDPILPEVILEKNTILDLETGRLILIDPH